MENINIVVEQGAKQHLRRAEPPPGKIALKREPHSPCIEPRGYFSMMDTLAHEMIDRILKCNHIVF